MLIIITSALYVTRFTGYCAVLRSDRGSAAEIIISAGVFGEMRFTGYCTVLRCDK